MNESKQKSMEKKRQTGQKHTMTTKLSNRRGKKKQRKNNKLKQKRKKKGNAKRGMDRQREHQHRID